LGFNSEIKAVTVEVAAFLLCAPGMARSALTGAAVRPL